MLEFKLSIFETLTQFNQPCHYHPLVHLSEQVIILVFLSHTSSFAASENRQSIQKNILNETKTGTVSIQFMLQNTYKTFSSTYPILFIYSGSYHCSIYTRTVFLIHLLSFNLCSSKTDSFMSFLPLSQGQDL